MHTHAKHMNTHMHAHSPIPPISNTLIQMTFFLPTLPWLNKELAGEHVGKGERERERERES